MQYEQELVELFQDYSAHYELFYKLSPLTAQVFTYIMFNSGNGVNFDEMVVHMKASKSSISSSLNLLIKNGQVEHFNKINERKRYFRINPNFLITTLSTVKDNLEREMKLGSKMIEFMHQGKIQSNCCDGKMNLYLQHLDDTTKNIAQVIEKLNNLK